MGPGRETAVILIVYTTLSSFFVCVRCLSRFVIIKNHGIDDYMIICAQVFSIAFTIMLLFQVRYGLGNPKVYLNVPEFEQLMKFFYAGLPFYHAGLALAKDSILFQYLRFFPPSRYRQICWIMITFTSVHALLALVWGFSICIPVAYVWDRTLAGKCYLLKLGYINSVLAIISDLIICALPIPVLKYMKTSKAQRRALMCVFALGGWSCLAAAFRIPCVIRMIKAPVLGSDNNCGMRWSSIELNAGTIAACLPTLKPMLQRLNCLPKFLCDRTTKNSEPEELTPISNSSRPAKAIKSIHTLSRSEIEASETTLKWPLAAEGV